MATFKIDSELLKIFKITEKQMIEWNRLDYSVSRSAGVEYLEGLLPKGVDEDTFRNVEDDIIQCLDDNGFIRICQG